MSKNKIFKYLLVTVTKLQYMLMFDSNNRTVFIDGVRQNVLLILNDTLTI